MISNSYTTRLFEGSFNETRDFRRSLYTEKISDMDDALSEEDRDFAGKYLRGAVSWYTNYKPKCFFYNRH